MTHILSRRRAALTAIAVGVLSAALAVALARGGPSPAAAEASRGGLAHIELLAPENGDRAGIGSRGWFIDLEASFKLPLEKTGYDPAAGIDGLQLTGPGVHNNALPFPGSFSPGQDERFKSLIVLVATNGAGAGRNVANLFNLTGVTNRSKSETEIWDTWIVGAPGFGRNVRSTVYAAIAADKDGNGILDDAPGTVPDADGDGDVDAKDLRAFGVASNIERADFFIRD